MPLVPVIGAEAEEEASERPDACFGISLEESSQSMYPVRYNHTNIGQLLFVK